MEPVIFQIQQDWTIETAKEALAKIKPHAAIRTDHSSTLTNPCVYKFFISYPLNFMLFCDI
ncbi:MAG: hypothetical protein H0V82_09785 [Candidatus Protochlamydia sp.]|nr:hypothetical protein [Candidatus Protochlamydia sp.]MBA3603952.1 hypothetical protein [Parachlamydiaceae bacterium]